MAEPTHAERLEHMLLAIDDIETQTAGLTREAFKQDRFRRLGIERCIEIISEASRKVPEHLKAAHPEIPWPRVADIGNRIRHAYHAVDSDILWEIIQIELKVLRAALESMAKV